MKKGRVAGILLVNKSSFTQLECDPKKQDNGAYRRNCATRHGGRERDSFEISIKKSFAKVAGMASGQNSDSARRLPDAVAFGRRKPLHNNASDCT